MEFTTIHSINSMNHVHIGNLRLVQLGRLPNFCENNSGMLGRLFHVLSICTTNYRLYGPLLAWERMLTEKVLVDINWVRKYVQEQLLSASSKCVLP